VWLGVFREAARADLCDSPRRLEHFCESRGVQSLLLPRVRGDGDGISAATAPRSPGRCDRPVDRAGDVRSRRSVLARVRRPAARDRRPERLQRRPDRACRIRLPAGSRAVAAALGAPAACSSSTASSCTSSSSSRRSARSSASAPTGRRFRGPATSRSSPADETHTRSRRPAGPTATGTDAQTLATAAQPICQPPLTDPLANV
jgi:hypothetical protein